MENRNIYKLDDVLLFFSVILLVPAAYFAWPWLKGLPEAGDWAAYVQEAPSVIGPRMIYVLSYLAGALLTQISGRYLRYQEKLSLKILDEVGYARKIRISEMSSRLGMNDRKVEKLVRKLSRVKSLNIGIEGDRIVRNRKSAAGVPPRSEAWDREGRNSDARSAHDHAPQEDREDSFSRSFVSETVSTADRVDEVRGKQEDLRDLFEQMRNGKKPDIDELRRKGFTVETKTTSTTSGGEDAGEDLRNLFEQLKSGKKVDFDELRRKGFNVETKTQHGTESGKAGAGKLPFSPPVMGLLLLLFMSPLWPIPLVIFIRKALKMRGMSGNDES
jgi:biotin operon repressor